MKTPEDFINEELKANPNDRFPEDRLPYIDVNGDKWYHIDDVLSAMKKYGKYVLSLNEDYPK